MSLSRELNPNTLNENSIESNILYHSKDEITQMKITKKPISKLKESKIRVSSPEHPKAKMKTRVGLNKGKSYILRVIGSLILK